MTSPEMPSQGALNLDTAMGANVAGWGKWFLEWQETVQFDREHGVKDLAGPFGSMAVAASGFPEAQAFSAFSADQHDY